MCKETEEGRLQELESLVSTGRERLIRTWLIRSTT